MDTKALEGSVSIIVMLVIASIILYFLSPELARNGLILIGIVIIVGLINGYVFDTVIRQSITYIVVIGEILIGVLSVILYFSFQNDLTNNTQNTGLEGLGLILIFIILVAVLIIGFVGFIILGIALYIPALVGKSMKKSGKNQL